MPAAKDPGAIGSSGETGGNAQSSAGQSGQNGHAPDLAREVSIWQYLTFLLGLIPVVVAVLRVVLVAQGDDATLYTLVQTLDVPALVIATYGRYVGVLGVGVTLPLLLYSRGNNNDGTRSIRLDPPARIVLLILLACSIICIYPEEIFDDSVISIWPVDIFRALGWACAVYMAARWWDMRRSDLKPGKLFNLIKTRFNRAASWFDRAATSVTGHRVETWVIAPALVLLLWSYLVGNNRMWLPAQVVTIHGATAAITLDAPPVAEKPTDLQSGKLADGDLVFVAYILSRDSSGFTIMTVVGRVVHIPVLDLTDQVPCQFESDYDPRYDEPLLFFLPGHGELPRSTNLTCRDWMRKLTS